MFDKMWSTVSFGNRYVLASLVYIGLGLIVVNAMPGVSVMLASGTECDDETPCSSGEACCDGACIPEDDLCCEDGTSGPAEDCACCDGGGPAPATYSCDE